MKVKMYLSREEDSRANDGCLMLGCVYIWFQKMNGHAEGSHNLPYSTTVAEATEAGKKIAAQRGNEIVETRVYPKSWQ